MKRVCFVMFQFSKNCICFHNEFVFRKDDVGGFVCDMKRDSSVFLLFCSTYNDFCDDSSLHSIACETFKLSCAGDLDSQTCSILAASQLNA
jgi:hypothetical protein